MRASRNHLMLRQAQHEGLYFSLTLSLSKGEAGFCNALKMPTNAYIRAMGLRQINGLSPLCPVQGWCKLRLRPVPARRGLTLAARRKE